ncbi:acyltransferase [Thalassotalea euphylliae]|uniref:Acyltransferase n=1 Tax=Thalassotalea euphylliae TaxID=1655234 RepID=A0A3E0TXP9_9GAMM|nr:acyltransferase [Thalassotalea euphylliae]REL29378.1 acyltransferase [Thalassotalea euphylliae]
MLTGLPSFILMPFAFALFCLNLAFNGTLVFLGGLLKTLIPVKAFHQLLYCPMHTFYRLWTYNNTLILRLINRSEWEIKGAENLSKDAWYLILANHQSWLDILVIAEVARQHTPEPKFFLKESLKKIPFLGMACWALDMPFMKRYSKAFVAKNPHLKGQDIETTKKSCQSFRDHPTTIINFVEGTRFTKRKHERQQSPFRYLLKPKAGGIAFTLATLGEQFDKVLNITVLYPDNPGHVMKDMLKGKLGKVIVHIEAIDINQALIGDYFEDPEFKAHFQEWLNQQWLDKDQLIHRLYCQQEQEEALKNQISPHQST